MAFQKAKNLESLKNMVFCFLTKIIIAFSGFLIDLINPRFNVFRKHSRLVEGLRGVDTQDTEEEGFDEVNV